MTVAPSELCDLTADEVEECVAGAWTCAATWYDYIGRMLNGRAWIANGNDSWDAFCDERLNGLRLTVPLRREAVTMLRSQGHSTRAIASGLGVDDKTVRNDLKSGADNSAPAPVTGLDGKTYTPSTRPPAPTPVTAPVVDKATGEINPPPARRPISEQTAEEAREISNRVASRTLAECVWHLANYGAPTQTPAVHAANWDASQDIFPEPCTPARMRQAATITAFDNAHDHLRLALAARRNGEHGAAAMYVATAAAYAAQARILKAAR